MSRYPWTRGITLALALLLVGSADLSAQELSIDDVMLLEGDAGTVDAVFTVTLVNTAGGTVTVDFQTADGSATEIDADYVGASGVLTFTGVPDPELQFVTVQVVGDTSFEPDEFFLVDLSNAVGAQILDGQGIGTIQNDDALTLSIGDATVTEGDAGTINAVFTVTLSGEPQQSDVTVDFASSNGTATVADNDYVATSGSLLFPAPAFRGGGALGPITQVVTVTVNGDTQVESDETFFVNLMNAVGAPIIDGQGDGLILNDDLPTLTIDDVSVSEGSHGTTGAFFTVTLSDTPPVDVTVDFATRDGTAAAADGDYVAISGSMFFPALGSVTGIVTVTINGDTVTEPDETFFVDLSNPAGATIADGEGAGTILNDDQVMFSIDDVTLSEGDSGGRDAVFKVTLSNTSQETVAVDAATRDGTATDGDDDYVPSSSRLTFAPGETVRRFSVRVRGDTRPENDESFFVDLANPSGGSIADGEGEGTIRDDDETSEIRLVDVPSASEASGAATVTLQRTGGVGAAQVTVSTVSGTALAGEDFVALSEVVVWGAGETGIRSLEVQILDDNLEEGDETLRVELTSPIGADLGEPTELDLVIVDDDMPMELEILGDDETLSIVNGEVGLQVRVSRTDGTPVQGATVLWSLEGDAELVGGDATLSDAEGVATNQIQLGSTPGNVLVTARLAAGDGSTTFEITVEGDLTGLFDEAANPAEASVAGVLDAACARAVGAFAQACDYLFGLDDPADRQQVVRELTPREAAAQGTFSLDSMRVQQRNIGSRLAALRGGGTGDVSQAADQLAFQSDEIAFSVAQLRTDQRAPEEEVSMRHFEGAWWEEPPSVEVDQSAESIDEVSRWGLFVNGSVSMGQRDETPDEEGFDFDSTGVTFGVDYRLSDRTVIGGAVGLLRTKVDLDRRGGGFDADGFSLSAYGLLATETVYATGVLTFGQLDLDLVRSIDLPAPFQGQDSFLLAAATDSDQLSIALEVGYDKAFGASVLNTFGRLSLVDATIDDYAETGDGPFALIILGQDIESLLAEGGINWSHAASRSWGIAQTALRLSYLHEFEDSSRLIRGRFVEDLEGNEFAVPTDAPDRNFFNLGVGVTATLPRGRSFFVFVDSDLARDDLDRYTVSIGLRWEL